MTRADNEKKKIATGGKKRKDQTVELFLDKKNRTRRAWGRGPDGGEKQLRGNGVRFSRKGVAYGRRRRCRSVAQERKMEDQESPVGRECVTGEKKS